MLRTIFPKCLRNPIFSKNRISRLKNESGRIGSLKLTMRIPKQREPTHPGEMLLEEFLIPMEMSQEDLVMVTK
jgi:hypothetical protein